MAVTELEAAERRVALFIDAISARFSDAPPGALSAAVGHAEIAPEDMVPTAVGLTSARLLLRGFDGQRAIEAQAHKLSAERIAAADRRVSEFSNAHHLPGNLDEAIERAETAVYALKRAREAFPK